MTRDEIEELLNQALDELLEKDSDILEVDINERSISHRLATYIESRIGAWNVDCEYNRNHDSAKRLDFPRGNVPNDDIQARTVYPDIIVHRRRKEENLLVIEMKKSTSQESDESDLRKLRAFKDQLGYVFAVFIKIRTESNPTIVRVDWI